MRSWCSKNGDEVQHMRELSNMDGSLKGHHVVFDGTDAEKIEEDSFDQRGLHMGDIF